MLTTILASGRRCVANKDCQGPLSTNIDGVLEEDNEQHEVGSNSEFLEETYELLNNPNHLSRYRQKKIHSG